MTSNILINLFQNTKAQLEVRLNIFVRPIEWIDPRIIQVIMNEMGLIII